MLSPAQGQTELMKSTWLGGEVGSRWGGRAEGSRGKEEAKEVGKVRRRWEGVGRK